MSYRPAFVPAAFLSVILSVLASTLPVFTAAAPLTDEEQKAIDAEMRSRVTFEPGSIDSLALRTVFDATFYQVEIKIREGEATSRQKMLLVRNAGKFVEVGNTTTNRKMPGLLALIKKDFKIRNDEDAATFEEAIDLIYPLFSDRDRKEVARRQDGKAWLFVRGKFFDSEKGFVVKTDDAGTVTDVAYYLKMEKRK